MKSIEPLITWLVQIGVQLSMLVVYSTWNHAPFGPAALRWNVRSDNALAAWVGEGLSRISAAGLAGEPGTGAGGLGVEGVSLRITVLLRSGGPSSMGTMGIITTRCPAGIVTAPGRAT